MKVTNEMINKANDIIDETFDYTVFGIRVQDVPFEMGEMTHVSHVWDDGDDTGEELNGVCVTRIEDAKRNHYYGDHVALIGGTAWEYGEDDGEVIISDPVVLAILN
ncbi:MAG: hypothetical protein LUC48_07460 [Clostridiales bacterium]|nr:hypothetical protein [Clostridiales bacterium]